MLIRERGLRQGRILPSLLGAVVVVSAAVVFWSVLAQRTYDRASGMHCANNLKQIYAFARAYAERKGSFPLAAPGRRAHDVLNDLVAFDPEGFFSVLLTCPESEGTLVEIGPGRKFILGPSSLSYAWTTVVLKRGDPPRPLASDKYVDGFEDAEGVHSGHKGGMNVLYTDGSIQWVGEADLPPDTKLPEGLTR